MNKREARTNNLISIILFIISILTLVLLLKIDVLPTKYFILTTIGVLAVDIILWRLICNKGRKRTVALIISIIMLVLMFFSIIYELSTLKFLRSVSQNNYKTVTYEVVVLIEDGYSSLSDLEKKNISILNTYDEEYKMGVEYFDKQLEYTKVSSNSYSSMILDLLTHSVDAILIEKNEDSIYRDNSADYNLLTKVIYSFEIKVEVKDIAKRVNVTNEPFNIYISGVDTFGLITSVARSDLNMVVSINPVTRKASIISIPRDYYVPLATKNGNNDLISHAGMYGITESVETIENLLDININYYMKLNFTSIVDVVDALGGVTVNSDYEFTTKEYPDGVASYTFVEGPNYLTGEKTLAFVREKGTVEGGDRTRNRNEQIVIRAIIDKALSPAILTKYTDLLDSLSYAFETNLTDDEITSFAKYEIDQSTPWQIDSYVLEGIDDKNYTYSYQDDEIYIVEPYKESIAYAKSKINKVFQK